MSWAERRRAIAVGDTVGYSTTFLRSISCFLGHLPHARGTVLALVPISPDVTLAEVAWNDDEVPLKVNVENLDTGP